MKRKPILVILLLLPLMAFAKSPKLVDRIEPLSWWAGMARTDLQLMLHGTDIASADVSFANNALKISRIEKTDNPNFLFVYVDTKNAAAGNYKLTIKKGKKRQVVDYQLNERAKGSAERPSFGPADVFYLIMPDRFANGNPQNDTVKGLHADFEMGNLEKRQGGDIQGIIDHLDYIADLGCTTIWPTPLFYDNEPRFSYHHYATGDYYRIDPRFGTNNDYRRLADSCHRHGLKLVMDIVPNHCGTSHWWMNDLPASDWFHTWPKLTITHFNVSIWTNPNVAKHDIDLLKNGWFDATMPDLNLENPLLFDYLRQVYCYWIELVGIDGLRVDTYPYNDIFTASKLMNALNAEYPNLSLVGECWVKSVPQTAFFQTGANNKNGFDSGLQSVMDFTLKDCFEFAFLEDEAWNKGMIRFYNHFAQNGVYPNMNMVMNMLDNHDMDRFPAVVKRDVRLVKMGIAMISTIRGYPQFYYGDEVLIPGDCGRYESARYTFLGGWNSDSHNAFAPKQRTADESEVYNYMKRMLDFRRNCTALHTGEMLQFLPNDGIYVYFRYNDAAKVMVMANNANEAKTVDLERYNEMEIIGKRGYNVGNDEHFIIGQTLEIPAKTVFVVEIK